MQAELAIGQMEGTWQRVWVNVPAGENASQMSEAQLTDLLLEQHPEWMKKEVYFVHLIYLSTPGGE